MGNRERNSYVIEQITEALINMLETTDLSAISVSSLIKESGVSRNSFYRNFEDKEDVLRRRIDSLLGEWEEAYSTIARGSNAELYGSLFAHLEQHSQFYLLLSRRGLFYLFREAYMHRWGTKPEMNDTQAFVVAFIAHGTCGWIEEWFARGMKESGDEMADKLAALGMA